MKTVANEVYCEVFSFKDGRLIKDFSIARARLAGNYRRAALFSHVRSQLAKEIIRRQ